MALYVQASISASLGMADFPRLTFDGFKKRKLEKHQPWTSKYKTVKELSQFSSPVIKRARSFQESASSSDGLLCRSATFQDSHSKSDLNKRWSDSTQEALIIGGSDTASSASSQSSSSQTDKRNSHCRSDSCVKKCDLASIDDVDDKPSIAVINSHSSLKCGTNIKTWYIKLALINVIADDTVSVAAQGEIVKIKIKYGKKTSGIDKLFGCKQLSVKKNLKFAGTVDPKSLRTKLDNDGCLVIQMVELLNY